MERCQLPTAISDWIDSINRADITELEEAMSPSHTFFAEGESPTIGPDRNVLAWEGYFRSFPRYKIFVDACYLSNETYYILGHTSGSHVPAELESVPESVIWEVEIHDHLIDRWVIYDGKRRRELEIPV